MAAHVCERQRSDDGHLGYYCSTCGQWWTRQPSSGCPGVQGYWSWDEAHAQGLRTLTQWKEQRRRVVKDAQPLAVYLGGRDWYWLYGETQTVAMRDASEAQRAVLERGRINQRLCKKCGHISPWPLQRGVCVECWAEQEADEQEEMIAEARAEATAWAQALLGRSDWVVLDTETTSLDAPEIVEIAVLAPDGAVLLDTRVRPLSPITDGARAIHGITAESLADAPTWPAIYPQLQALLDGRHILAYNADFDADAIYHTCQLHQTAQLVSAKRWLDLMEQFAAWYGDWSERRGDFRWQPLPGGAHSAREDCLASLALLRMMASAPNVVETVTQ